MKDSSLPLGRFSKLFSSSECLLPPYDRVLQRHDGCVVVPTLGSILPNWLLIVPEIPVLNFREWEARGGGSAEALVRKFLNSRDIQASRAIWFEHGPSETGTSVGCGLDHAHLHVLIDAPFGLEQFIDAAERRCERQFVSMPTTSAFQQIPVSVSYLMIAAEGNASVATGIDNIGSQFLRRVIADLAGEPNGWNYRTHPWLSNVEKTLQAFSPV